MTPKQKAKAYDEAEDERIRKSIIAILNNYVDNSNTFKPKMLVWLEKQGKKSPFNKERLMEVAKPETFEEQIEHWRRVCCIAEKRLKELLEKQEEQKPFDYEKTNIQQKDFAPKIEPKFHKGDWVTNSIETVQITGYDIDYGYQVNCKGKLLHRDIDIIEKEYHLWTINDAKDGDVLTTQGSVFIFKHLDKTGRSLCKSYCEVIDNSGLGLGFEFSINDVCPATKEQRDFLFQKMKEAGWEWDADKKELSKRVIDEGKDEMDYCFTKMMNGEKVSSIWSEEDEKMVKDIIAAIDTLYYHGMVNWLKSLKDRVQPQNMWKPSKEQIVALRWILNNIPYNKHKEEISGLLDQIKHL